MRLRAALLSTVVVMAIASAWANAAVNDSREPEDRNHLNRVHVVYVTNRDREPGPGYRERLHRIMTDVQDFYRSEMERNGFGPMTFPLDQDEAGRTRVHLVTLDWDFDPIRKFTPREIRPAVAKRLAEQGIDIAQSYFVAFLNAYWQDGNVWKYDVVYTGSGRPGHGATWVTDHALLDPANLDPKRKGRINDRGHKLTIGQFNVKMIGGVAHEFGHSLGLPHNRERPEERVRLGKALMGAGNYTYRRKRLGRAGKDGSQAGRTGTAASRSRETVARLPQTIGSARRRAGSVSLLHALGDCIGGLVHPELQRRAPPRGATAGTTGLRLPNVHSGPVCPCGLAV